jgi:hypothetical protein
MAARLGAREGLASRDAGVQEAQEPGNDEGSGYNERRDPASAEM